MVSWPRLRTVVLVGAWGMSACVKGASPPPPPPAPPPLRTDLAVPPSETAPTFHPGETSESGEARFFPGADSARSPRARKATAVLLFAPPGSRVEDGALSSVSKLRLQPLVCSLAGKLGVGARCGEAMPARVKVRLTAAGGVLDLEELELERSTDKFRDEAGHKVYPPPYGPACCMYNTCVGKTVPYYPKDSHDGFVLTTDKTILAVWPADAEIDLSVFAPGRSEEVKLSDGPWTRAPEAATALQVSQAVLFRGRRYASLSASAMGHGLFADGGGGWQLVLNEMGVREYLLLAAADLDGDGRPELVVYSRWANDYGLHVLGGDPPKSIYSFSCGNI